MEITGSVIINFVFGLVLLLGGNIIRSIMHRLDAVEKRANDSISEEGVRRILTDKLEPMNENIKEIKEDMKKVYDLFLNALTKPKE